MLRADDMTPAALLAILEELTPTSETSFRCWLEAVDGWALDHWHGVGANLRWNSAGRDHTSRPLSDMMPRVVSGRVFSASGELKWRRLPSLGERCCRVVFLGEGWPSAALEMLPERDELKSLHREEAVYPLWGQLTSKAQDAWIDLRIPHRLHYPVNAVAPAQGRIVAKAVAEIWKDASGEPQFIRLRDLIAEYED